MPFKNFRMWRKRLPHWRADDETYYVTFRHRRPLDSAERLLLFRALLNPDGRRWNILILCVLPENTEILFTVTEKSPGVPYELSDIVEKAKDKAGRKIIKATGERFTPFYTESYDRIVRDEAELDERWQAILDAPVSEALCESPEDYNELWVVDAPR
ncbi:MAG: hypothetical protein JSS72_06170 [Armatimonadetes bacterium]|nr:hypothetical protein [Armatimonadota bacterium]